MKKAISLLVIGLMLFSNSVMALNLSRVKTWGAEVLTHTDLNAEFDNVLNHSIANADVSASAAIVASKLDLTVAGAIGSTTPNTGAFTTLASTGATTIGDAVTDTLHINSNVITLEGHAADANEITIETTTLTGDSTLTIPDADSVTLPSGAVFFMIANSCPAATTDITATYSNKFIRINATQASTGGADAHTHGVGSYSTDIGSFASGSQSALDTNAREDGAQNKTSAHTHAIDPPDTGLSGISGSGDNVPAYVTMKICQVD